jgi:ankyrin repeat protein
VKLHPLPLLSRLDDYQKQADQLLEDGQRKITRWYEFESWPALADYVEAVTRADSPVFEFESAVEAVISGDLAALESSLKKSPELARARSIRKHRATLLHYVAANGVEDYRQKSPKNAARVAEILLRAGAEVDALAEMYGGQATTMNMLVSSTPPAESGVQVALVETLLDFGAAMEGSEAPLMTALAFGHRAAAEALVRRGAKVDNIAAAAGLGRVADARRMLETSDAHSRHLALALAAQHGHVEAVRLLLDAGEDPNRYNPKGSHAHSTPLHPAALAGHDAVVRLLVERGAKLDIEDTMYHGTPLAWAKHGGRVQTEQYLRAHGAA